MAVQPVVLFPGTALTSGFVTLYTNPAGSGQSLTKILKVTVYNSDASNSHWFSLSIGTAGAATTCIVKRPLAPLETQDVPEIVNQLMASGEVLQMEADAGSVMAARGSGVLLT
jgi:hypothetical protein